MSQRYSPELVKKIHSLLTRYETKRSSILPILHAVQDERDWIAEEDVLELEQNFQLPAVEVREVLTFYSMYRKSPPKAWRFDVCNSISCWLMGSEKTIACIQKKLDEAEAKGDPINMEVHAVECLGVCGYAPAALINKDRYLNVNPELALKLVEEYAAKDLPPAARLCAEELRKNPPLHSSHK